MDDNQDGGSGDKVRSFLVGENRALKITPEAREYLEYQRGYVRHLAGTPEWEEAFLDSILTDWEQICPGLPTHAPIRVLDIGAGMGTIDILMSRHYDNLCPQHPSAFVLVDGTDDAPKPTKSWKTHSHGSVAMQYLAENVAMNHSISYVAPSGLARLERGFDLVVSLGSWCFHYEPAHYLTAVMQLVNKDTTFILDVRKERPHWEEQLMKKLEIVKVLADLPKAQRAVLKVR